MKENKTNTTFFLLGCKRLVPISLGVIPFGLIVGTIASQKGLSLIETIGMNVFVFAGASQLAMLDLMDRTPAIIVILTGLIINIRFVMYSTSLAPLMEKYDPLRKIGLAHLATDQSYALSMNEFPEIEQRSHKVSFYVGASLAMFSVWQCSTILGYYFGNFAPKSLALDFVVPLAFMSLIVPSFKNKSFVIVAMISGMLSIVSYKLPYNLGLILSALIALSVGIIIEKNKKAA